MAFNSRDDRGVYQELSYRPQTHTCTLRSDDGGLYNAIKAWYLIVLHLLASIALILAIKAVNGRDFNIGSGPRFYTLEHGLYQAQVTALVSLALVIIRLVSTSCTTLLAWRIVSILMEKRGLTLGELTRLVDWRTPIKPWKNCAGLWSAWAVIATLLLWPPTFVAPLASSSISWIPNDKIAGNLTPTTITSTGQYAEYSARTQAEWRIRTVLAGSAMTAQNASYAFKAPGLPLRRYFNSTEVIPHGSSIDMNMPYFSVDLRWINASSDNRSSRISNTEYIYVDKDFSISTLGAVAIVREEPWDASAPLPTEPIVYGGKQLVAVKLRTLEFGKALPDGSIASNTTKCLTTDSKLGRLPDVEQHQVMLSVEGSDVAHDCYIFAEATITAGTYSTKDCSVVARAETADQYATCYIERDDASVVAHWLTGFSLDFMSEVLKYTALLNYSQPWITNNLDDYTGGMLMLGYHAAFSSLIKTLGNDTEGSEFRAARPMIAASVDDEKLYLWLATTALLTISAILVAIAQRTSVLKNIRNPTLSALLMDFSEVTHGDRAEGLCNAVTLSKSDKEIEMLRWNETSNCRRGILKKHREGESQEQFPLQTIHVGDGESTTQLTTLPREH